MLTEIDGRQLSLSNLDKVLFPDGTTKGELISYYVAVAPTLLAHLRGRCLTRLRFPDGTPGTPGQTGGGEGFYEKNAPAGTPEWVTTQQVEAAGSMIDYVVADHTATVVWLANLAAIELHAPQWRLQDSPSQQPIRFDGAEQVLSTSLVVDLDPGEGIRADQLATAAMMAATALAGEGLVPFVKTSGSKGLQVVCAIEPTGWREVTEQVRFLGLRLAAERGDLFVTTMTKQARAERIYVDHLQNRADRNTICAYSVRGRDQARVSTPLSWDEVAALTGDHLPQYTIADLPRRLDEHADLWSTINDPATAAPLPQWSGPNSTTPPAAW